MDPFLEAVSTGDLPLVEMMLADHSLVRMSTPEGVPVLLYALHRGHEAVARAIAARVTRLSLPELAALGDADRVQDLIARSPDDLDQYAPDGYTALGLAVLFARLPVVKVLLGAGADPNLPSIAAHTTYPLHSATTQAQPGMALALVRLLLAGGADPNARAQGGWTALHNAAAMGYREVASVLVEHGADMAPETEAGKTPGQVAMEFGFDGVAEWLREAAGPAGDR